MKHLNEIIRTLIDLRQAGKAQMTLLAVCPNSTAVLEAAVKAASLNNSIMLFAATLNQVDLDGGYTGWTPVEFVRQMHNMAVKYAWDGPLYPCLDHGGPWLKDRHTLDHLSYEETIRRVKDSLVACLEAGYQLLHIDPTVDRNLPTGEPVPLGLVVERTIELIEHVERERKQRNLTPVAYEVGTEEVHGGLVDYIRFEQFLAFLRDRLQAKGLMDAWPCFVVAQVGTDLHTTYFDPAASRRLYQTLSPLGSLVKGHYSDWVENPHEYPETGMGGANVGPEFTAEEYLALKDLENKEICLFRNRAGLEPAGFMQTLQSAVVESGRWQKWLLPEERGLDFTALKPDRKEWLLQTGSRYIWTDTRVMVARQKLYANLSLARLDPHGYVVDRIVGVIDKYINSFGLFDSNHLFM